jgi:hypothetical protein
MQIMVDQKTNGVCAMFGQLIHCTHCTREITSGIAVANATFGEEEEEEEEEEKKKKKKTLFTTKLG